MAYSYKGTSLLQAGAFEAISYLHPILMFVSKAEAYPCGTFQPCIKVKLRCNRLTITKALAYNTLVLL